MLLFVEMVKIRVKKQCPSSRQRQLLLALVGLMFCIIRCTNMQPRPVPMCFITCTSQKTKKQPKAPFIAADTHMRFAGTMRSGSGVSNLSSQLKPRVSSWWKSPAVQTADSICAHGRKCKRIALAPTLSGPRYFGGQVGFFPHFIVKHIVYLQQSCLKGVLIQCIGGFAGKKHMMIPLIFSSLILFSWPAFSNCIALF